MPTVCAIMSPRPAARAEALAEYQPVRVVADENSPAVLG
jgi:hypothetical protein